MLDLIWVLFLLMNVVGPCLSPVSFAVQKFHNPKTNKERITDSNGCLINPMLARKIVYSPPLARRLKRKRSQFEHSNDDGIYIDKIQSSVELPVVKKQKTKHVACPQHHAVSLPISTGRRVHVRFDKEKDEYVKAVVILNEKYNTLVVIKEENINLPQIPLFSKHWACWKGEVKGEYPVLDILYPAE